MAVGLLASRAAVPAADTEKVKEIGQKLMCNCSCNQLLVGCTHIGCPNSGPMRAELAAYIDKGMTEQEILDAFVAKYGKAILSSPPATGFNISAWVMPFVALGAGLFGVAYAVRQWKKKAPTSEAVQPPANSYESRVEEELSRYSPED